MSVEKVLWEGDKYRAVVDEVRPDHAVFDVQKLRDGEWLDFCLLMDFGERYRKYRTSGYPDPHRWWWFDHTSIDKASEKVVRAAQRLERKHCKTQRQIEKTRQKVEASVGGVA